MTVKSIPGSDFFKSLGKLEAAAQGGKTNEQPGDLSKAQLFHTPTSSEQTTWPGGQKSEIGNKWDDSIGADGTDYHPARKSIAEKALKGLPLSPEEIAILKSDIEQSVVKAQPCDDDKDDKKDGKKGDEKDEKGDEKDEKKLFKKMMKSAVKEAMKAFGGADMNFQAKKAVAPAAPPPMAKSFEAAVQGSETIQKGIELSDFLTELVKAFGSGLEGIESRTVGTVEQATNAILSQMGGYLDARFAEQAEFNKSLAEAVVNIGHGVAGNIEQLSEVAQAPAGAPKSQLRAVPGVRPLEKSFGGPQGTEISKAQKLDAMVDMVEKGQLNSLEVVKFDAVGQIRPEVEAAVVRHIQSGGK